jgi:hypothetical protein
MNSSAMAGALALPRHLPNIHQARGHSVGQVARTCRSVRVEIGHG